MSALGLLAAVLGDPGCAAGQGPAVMVTAEGLKDRRGEAKLEIYPAAPEDWLKDDRDLRREGKFFHRVRVGMPAAGPVVICARLPGPGRYGLLFTHNRDGKNKFSFWVDGVGVPGSLKLGRARPKPSEGAVQVGTGVTAVTVRTQYLRGLRGFAPVRR